MTSRRIGRVVDRTALRVERIRQNLGDALCHRTARPHPLAVLAVSFTVLTSIGVAALTKQLDPVVALAGMTLPAIALVLKCGGSGS